MIDEANRIRIEKYWASELGCSVETLAAPGLKVLMRADPAGAFVLRYGGSCIWHVPARFVEQVARGLEGQGDMERVFQVALIKGLFGAAVKLVLGPCPIAYCTREMMRVHEGLPACRRLGSGDKGAVEQLAADCGAEAWEHGGVELEHRAVFGCFSEQRLVAAASYEIWGVRIAHVGVVTAPASRGRGFAKAVGTAATDDALREGLVPQWRTLASNRASVAVGRGIGFEAVAEHFFVRLAVE